MSASLRMRIGAAAAVLACLAMGSARAQQRVEREVERESDTGSARTDIDIDTESGQTDRSRAGQADRNRAEQNRSQLNQRQQGRRHTAGFRGTPGAASNASQQVEEYIVSCLLLKNEGEIDIAKFAEQQSENPEVKKFAQMLVQDHQQLVEKLQQLKQGQAATPQPDQSLSTETRIESQAQSSDTTRLPGSPGAGQPRASDETPTIEARPGIRDTSETVTIDAPAGQGRQRNTAVAQLIELDRQIAERCLNALKEELQQKQGAEFDMAFVGSQVGGHMQMQAALEVLGQQGPERIQQVAQEALPKVQAHLEHAKQLKEQLAGAHQRDASQAERPQPGAKRTPR